MHVHITSICLIYMYACMYTLHLYPLLYIENNEFVLISLMLIKHLRVHSSCLPFIFLNSFSKSEKAVCSVFTSISLFSVTSSPFTYYYVRMPFFPFLGQQISYLPYSPSHSWISYSPPLGWVIPCMVVLFSFLRFRHPIQVRSPYDTIFNMLRPLDSTLDRHPTFPGSDILCWPPVDTLFTLLWF